MDLLLKMDSEEVMATPTVTEINVDDSDEGTVFLQEGQFVVPVTRHTVLLEDSQGVLEQYLVNDGELYVHQEENDNKTDENPIVFYTKEEYCDEEPYTFIFPDDNIIEGDQVVIDSEIQPLCEYAILKDGKLHLQTVQMEELPTEITLEEDLQESIKIDEDTCTIDLNKITGRNLVTGQTVTLDHYFKKLQKQLVSVESVEDGGNLVDGGLINKKVTIGKTASGKKIVGKILHFQTSENADKMSLLSVTKEESKLHQPTLRKRCILTKENCDVNIGKTLVGLMDLETVRNKLRNKNLAVKIVDKVYNVQTKDFAKTISYVYGHMELTNNDDWSFEVHDAETSSAMVFITILTTVDSHGKKSMRVNLIPSMTQTRCHTCGKEFKSTQQIRRHIINAHLSEKAQVCDRCGKSFFSSSLLERHKRMLVCQKLHECPKCPKSFNSAGSLKRHVTVHDPSLRPLECTVCTQRFTDESSLRKHLLIHTGIRAYVCNICARSFRNRGDLNFHRRIHDPVKQFSCEICGRAFSRYSNMLRHTEIHRGTGALHHCDICGCSYSFVSSLTRHIVQKHLNCEQT